MSDIAEPMHATLPGKYKYLARLADAFPVPQMTLITEAHLNEWLVDFSSVKAEINESEQHIAITSGAFLTDDLARIERSLQRLRWRDEAPELLEETLRPFYREGAFNLAVRSACQIEDLRQHSFAGIYESVLNVTSMTALQAALIAVWRSFYSTRALMEKLNAKAIDQAQSMNMILQQMLQPAFAGVAFSCDPLTGADGLYIEYVEGLGEGLVSGERESMRLRPDSEDARLRQIYRQLDLLVVSARAQLNGHADVEWAWQDGKVWLLQARPVTNISQASYTPQPQLTLYPLYGELPETLLKRLPAYALYFNRKRKPLFDVARRHAIKQAGALILELNALALSSPEAEARILAHFSGDSLVIDFSDSVRQLIVPKAEVMSRLRSLMSDPRRLYIVVMRDFIKGEYGVITRQVATANGPALVAELSADGLLAMNRGSAVSEILQLASGRGGAIFSAVDSDVLFKVTAEAMSALGDVQVEWVYAGGSLFPLDYSPVGDSQIFISASGRVMAQGYARGQAFRVRENSELENYSIAPSMSLTDIPDAAAYGDLFTVLLEEMTQLPTAPILFAKRPYAALASLLPYVSGFVFEKGSLLCHLGVLLREKQLPAICDEQLYQRIQHGETFELDTTLID